MVEPALGSEEMPSSVDVPPFWVANFGRVARVSEEECVPASPQLGPAIEQGVGYAEGVVNFLSTAPNEFGVEIPCSISFDVSLLTEETYAWVPDIVTVQGTGITVAGACE